MADTSILDKYDLLKKPVPHKKKRVRVMIQPIKKESVAEKTVSQRRVTRSQKKPPPPPSKGPKIIDKTEEGYNRQGFMDKLLQTRGLSVPEPFAPVIPPPPKSKKGPPMPDVLPTIEESRAQDDDEERDEPDEERKPVGKLKKKKTRTLVLEPTSETRKRKPKSSKPKSSKPKSRRRKRKKKVAEPKETAAITDYYQSKLPVLGPRVLLKASSYFMNNREKFINFINTLFNPYIEEIEAAQDDVSCEKKAGDFSLLIHQKLVRDYINNLTPYRGLLLYHGLGSGKTCTSIGIAEGIRTPKKIVVMTPAALQTNFYSELKKCGNPLYKYNQYWEFLSTEDNEELVEQLHAILHISRAFIRKQGGAWFVDVGKKSNFNSLSTEDHATLDKQLEKMIKYKYHFINYNGLRYTSLDSMTFFANARKKKQNPFDNRVIIVDEAHNFVSRIINKLQSKKDSIYKVLYDYLKSAKNARLIFLTGTPIINYPNEIAILFNMLRGNINTFNIRLNIKSKKKINGAFFSKLFASKNLFLSDYIQYSSGSRKLQITRNPFGFVSHHDDAIYKGVVLNAQGDVDDKTFLNTLHEILSEKNIHFDKDTDVTIESFTALPEKLGDFNTKFFDNDEKMKDADLFKRRIMGLTSYYRSATEQLLPRLNDIIIEKIPMSRYQIGIYEQARKEERDKEKKNAKKKRARRRKKGDDIYEATSTYRIFSRAFCNFVFPPDKPRPFPKRGEADIDGDANENVLDNASIEQLKSNPDGLFTPDDTATLQQEKSIQTDKSYGRRITDAMKFLKTHSDRLLTPDFLGTYSPKFLKMLETIQNAQNIGSHLIYSQFRTLEGIGIFKLVLEANGFFEFKLKRNNITWQIAHPEHLGKPSFVLYTGTETVEEKEIIRNIFNGTWKNVPSNIIKQLTPISKDNKYGEIIKIFMITAAGAEGINLTNVRFVHITEPYWHPVRAEQVIGRARRICSHHALPEAERNVTVFLYLMTFSQELLDEEGAISKELKIHDLSKKDGKTPFTSDEALHEISEIKRDKNQQLLTAIKESSLDCYIHRRTGASEVETCFSFGDVTPDIFSYVPSIASSLQAKAAMEHKTKEKIKYSKFRIPKGVKKGNYAIRKYKNADGAVVKIEVYDFESIKMTKQTGAPPILLGELKQNAKKQWAKVVWF